MQETIDHNSSHPSRTVYAELACSSRLFAFLHRFPYVGQRTGTWMYIAWYDTIRTIEGISVLPIALRALLSQPMDLSEIQLSLYPLPTGLYLPPAPSFDVCPRKDPLRSQDGTADPLGAAEFGLSADGRSACSEAELVVQPRGMEYLRLTSPHERRSVGRPRSAIALSSLAGDQSFENTVARQATYRLRMAAVRSKAATIKMKNVTTH